MNILILGGNSKRHKQWVRDLKDSLKDSFDRVVYVDYAHWESGDEQADIEYEISQAARLASELGSYAIVAKSIGTVIAMEGIASGVLQPSSTLLMGLPLGRVASSSDCADMLSLLPPTTFLQNDRDPVGGAEDIRVFIESNPPAVWDLSVSSGDTHDYSDFALVRALLQNRD